MGFVGTEEHKYTPHETMALSVASEVLNRWRREEGIKFVRPEQLNHIHNGFMESTVTVCYTRKRQTPWRLRISICLPNHRHRNYFLTTVFFYQTESEEPTISIFHATELSNGEIMLLPAVNPETDEIIQAMVATTERPVQIETAPPLPDQAKSA